MPMYFLFFMLCLEGSRGFVCPAMHLMGSSVLSKRARPFDQSSQNVRAQSGSGNPTRPNFEAEECTLSLVWTLGTFSPEDVFPLRTFSSNNKQHDRLARSG